MVASHDYELQRLTRILFTQVPNNELIFTHTMLWRKPDKDRETQTDRMKKRLGDPLCATQWEPARDGIKENVKGCGKRAAQILSVLRLGGKTINRSTLTDWLLPDYEGNGKRTSTQSGEDPWPTLTYTLTATQTYSDKKKKSQVKQQTTKQQLCICST